MNLKLRHLDKHSSDCFAAWGVGLYYEYDSDSLTVQIESTRRKKPLMHIEIDEHLSLSAETYLNTFEKATQINALMFSNNRSIDLSDIFEEHRLKSILETCALFAKHSCDLLNAQYKDFEDSFCEHFSLKNLKIEKHVSPRSGGSLYTATLKTISNNKTITNSASMHRLLNNLSEDVVRDLIAQESFHPNQQTVHNLLSIASNLSVISNILNVNFDPRRKIQCFNAKKTHIKT